MDTIEFIKEKYRMCHYQDGCSHCSIYEKKGSRLCADWVAANPEQTIEIVEQWSQSHPQKTMMQDFFEKFPNAPKNPNGTPQFCPRYAGYSQQKDCTDCVNKYLECWSRPLEE